MHLREGLGEQVGLLNIVCSRLDNELWFGQLGRYSTVVRASIAPTVSSGAQKPRRRRRFPEHVKR